jgi:SusD family.
MIKLNFNIKHQHKIGFLFATLIICSCNKDWLNEKPNKSLVVPNKVKDFQAILDNSVSVYNVNYPALQEIATDDYYLLDITFEATENLGQHIYQWKSDPYPSEIIPDWSEAYKRILTSNIVLDGIEKVNPNSDISGWRNVKGTALFCRAIDYFNLTQLFCKPYKSISSDSELGLPLRLTPNVNEQHSRASLKRTYEQVLHDLIQSCDLLPIEPKYKTRPSKGAAYALLCRIFLNMEDYNQAKLYADSALSLSNTLLDFNTLSNGRIPLFTNNPEVLYNATSLSYGPISPLNAIVDSNLYNSYDTNDLRRSIFYKLFNNQQTFWGSYDGRIIPFFSGLATDEVLLSRAECNARLGNLDDATNDLNTLLEKRWITNTYTPFNSVDENEVLTTILNERRKEMAFRSTRWSDLRRLNTDTRFEKTLTRIINATLHSLPPNDNRYVFLIPENEISLSRIQQNPR